ncbi:MAG: OmpA family protein [Gemmatimonadetes bacterium]|nr:OmpA family protein [Gemmatimonadota bacterium]
MVEALLLSHEADLLSLASLAGVEEVPDGLTGEVTAGTGAARITRSIAAEVGALLADNERLGAALPVARRRADSLAAALAGTERRLREAEDRYLEARATLDALQADDARLREAMGLFTPAEGDVLLAGGDLVLRLHGINFESGVAEVGEGAEAILAKARQVIATFPNASVRVEGHTDATGGADANRVLSQRRAAAVREHLLRRLPIPASMMSAAGFGADRPISTNDTEEGRALNRRIEIVLTLPDR